MAAWWRRASCIGRQARTSRFSPILLSLAPAKPLPSSARRPATTLARLLIGVLAPTTGAVRLDGAEVGTLAPPGARPWLGYVPQDVELFDGSVADNIARLGPVDSEAVVAAAKRANVHEMSLTLAQGYDTLVGEHGARSPGQLTHCAGLRHVWHPGWWCRMSQTPTLTALARWPWPRP